MAQLAPPPHQKRYGLSMPDLNVLKTSILFVCEFSRFIFLSSKGCRKGNWIFMLNLFISSTLFYSEVLCSNPATTDSKMAAGCLATTFSCSWKVPGPQKILRKASEANRRHIYFFVFMLLLNVLSEYELPGWIS